MALVASGSARGAQQISNAQLGQRVDTSDEWIRTRTGIGNRCICGPDQSLADLSHQAGTQALSMAGWDADSLDLVELVMALEEEFDVNVEEEELDGVNTIQAAFDLVTSKL